MRPVAWIGGLELLARAGVSLQTFPGGLAVPALSACAAVVSLMLVLGVRRVPLLRRVV